MSLPAPFWRPDDAERAALAAHLRAELPGGHVLWPHMDALEVLGRDGDRLAVAFPGGVAVVTMTWAGRPHMAPFLPETAVGASLDEIAAEGVE
jgi:hypothetical protein